jgi:hypothetical protein
VLSDKLSFRDIIKNTILKKQLVEFNCKDQYIFAEPHAYGIKNGKILLIIYQLDGDSDSNRLPKWRNIDVTEISNIHVFDNKYFPGKRESSLMMDKEFDTVLELVT